MIGTNSQFKKGVLELIVLCQVLKKDQYGYELVENISKVFDINEGTIYPLLKRLTNEKYFDTYLQESSEGPPRKYYKITELGKERCYLLQEQWNDFEKSVSKFMKGMSKK